MRTPFLAALALVLPWAAGAAEITRLASSFEEKDPFGLFLDVGFERTRHKTKIVREHHQRDQLEEISELFYVGVDQRLNLDMRIGLYKDLEFHYGLPIVFGKDAVWRFASGTDASNSTITNNCLQPDGQKRDPNCPPAGTRPLFDVGDNEPNSYRGGLGDMVFGLSYGVFNENKDPSKPTWIVGLEYTAPTSETLDPTVLTSPQARGKLGDRVHRYKFFTSFSKRLGVADPYFQLHYTLPYKGPGWYSNCDHPENGGMGRPENCNTDRWTRNTTGVQPPHQGGIVFGSEFNAYEEVSRFQKVAIDFRGIVTYVSEGRYHNELSDPFHKLLYTQDFMRAGGQLGLVAHAAEYVHLRAYASLLYETEHNLTDEVIGRDFNGNGTVDITADPTEINPNFDWRTDLVSRRFRAVEVAIFRLDISASFNF